MTREIIESPAITMGVVLYNNSSFCAEVSEETSSRLRASSAEVLSPEEQVDVDALPLRRLPSTQTGRLIPPT